MRKNLNYRVKAMNIFHAIITMIYEIAQWYPRVTAYSDYEGWHNKEYQGSGEFTLEFGDFDVTITAPSDHIVASTGEFYKIVPKFLAKINVTV